MKTPKEQASYFLSIFEILFNEKDQQEQTEEIRNKLRELQKDVQETKNNGRHTYHQTTSAYRIVDTYIASARVQIEWLEMVANMTMQQDIAASLFEDVLNLLIMQTTKMEKKEIDRHRDMLMPSIGKWLEKYDLPWYNPVHAKRDGRTPHQKR